MAEAAAAAAALQFIDVGGRTLLLLARVISEIKDAPEKVRALHHEVQCLLELARTIQDEHSIPGLHASPLEDAVAQALSLEEFLGDLLTGPDDNLSRKAWKALRSAKNKERLDNLCLRLEHNKTTLIIWLLHSRERKAQTSNQSIVTIDQRTGSTDTNVQRLVQMSHELDSKTNKVSNQIQNATTIVQDIGLSNSGINDSINQGVIPDIKDTKVRVRDIGNDIQQGLLVGQENNARTIAIEASLQAQLLPSIQSLSDKIESEISRQLAEFTSSVNRFNVGMDEKISTEDCNADSSWFVQQSRMHALRLASKPAELSMACEGLLDQEQASTSSKNVAPKQRLSENGESLYPAPLQCSCRLKAWSYHLASGHQFSINYNGGKKHDENCFIAPFAPAQHSLRVRSRVSANWLRRIVQFTFSMTTGAGGFAISPSIATFQVVDRETSPAFRIMDGVIRDVHDIDAYKHPMFGKVVFNDLRVHIQSIKQILCEYFSSGVASPCEVDSNGENLLHVAFYMTLSVMDFILRKGIGQDVVKDIVQPILDVLAILSAFPFNMNGQNMSLDTPFDAFLNEALLLDSQINPIPHEIFAFCNKRDFTLCTEIRASHTESTTWKCLYDRVPSTIEYAQHSLLLTAVLQENEAEVVRLIAKGADVNQPSWDGLTPLSAALKWPKGCMILFGAGARLDVATSVYGGKVFTVSPDEDFLQLLLDSDQVLYPSKAHVDAKGCRSGYTILDHALYPRSRNTFPWKCLAGGIAERRQTLSVLARTVLPPGTLQSLGLACPEKATTLLDEYAVATADALETHGYPVPARLWPYGRRSVYDVNDIGYMTTTAANALYEAGFREIDVPNMFGFTPLQVLCTETNHIDVIIWFLDRGANIERKPAGSSRNCLHLLAARANGHHFDNIIRAPPELWSRILPVLGISSPDTSICACSANGCTATTMLFRRSPHTWHKKINQFQQWCDKLSLSAAEIETCCEELMRLETFERLDITHVCYYRRGAAGELKPMPEENQLEIMEEESEFIDELETWMNRYTNERAAFKGSAIGYLGKWSAHLKDSGLCRSSVWEKCESWKFKEGDLREAGYLGKTNPDKEIIPDIFWEWRTLIPGF